MNHGTTSNSMELTRGQTLYLVRPKRMRRAVFISEYEFPAVRIRLRNDEIIVRRNEVITEDERIRMKIELVKDKARSQNADLIAKWRSGMTSEEWRLANGWCIGEWSAIRKLKRLGIIE
jgi:hypothetical protein